MPWDLTGNIQGPPGEDGTNGTDGADGASFNEADYIPAGTTQYNTGWIACSIIGTTYAHQGNDVVEIRREGKNVEMRWGISSAGLSANANHDVLTFPAGYGFEPASFKYFPIASNNVPSNGNAVIDNVNRKISVRTGGSVGAYYMFDSCHWMVE